MKTPYQRYYSESYTSTKTIVANENTFRIVRNKLYNVPFVAKNTVLDIACGAGYFGTLFGSHLYGFDGNPKAVEQAKKNGVIATVADAEKKWKYPNNFFDIVLASHIIEHVRDPDVLILEARRVLKTNGYLVVLTPNLAAWFNRLLLLLGYQPFFTEVSTVHKNIGFPKVFTQKSNPVGHLRVFTPNALAEILTLHGFIIEKKFGTEFGSFPYWLRPLDKLLANFTQLAACVGIVARKKTLS